MEIWIIVSLAALIAFWVDGMRAREAAIVAARRACERDGLQLLDETVALSRLRPARDASGRMRLRRTYAFEFAVGAERRNGWVEMLGVQRTGLHLEWDGGLLLEQSDTHHGERQ